MRESMFLASFRKLPPTCRCFPASPRPYTRFSTVSSRPPFFTPFFGGYRRRLFSFSSYFWASFVGGGREHIQELGSSYPPSTVAVVLNGTLFWWMWTDQPWARNFWCITYLLWTLQVSNFWTLWISQCFLWFLRIATLRHFSQLFWMFLLLTVLF